MGTIMRAAGCNAAALLRLALDALQACAEWLAQEIRQTCVKGQQHNKHTPLPSLCSCCSAQVPTDDLEAADLVCKVPLAPTDEPADIPTL